MDILLYTVLFWNIVIDIGAVIFALRYRTEVEEEHWTSK